MPIVQITFVEGPSPDGQRKLIADVTEAVVRDLEVPAHAVNVVLTPVPAAAWGSAGRPLSDVL